MTDGWPSLSRPFVHHAQRRGAHARNDRSAFSRLSTGGTSGIASQFNLNAMSCVSVRIDESPRMCEVGDSAPATGHWKCFFQPRMNTGERGLWSERLRGRNGLGQANSGGVDSPLIPANYPVQSHRSVDASVFESLTCDSEQ
jgi:hypothetical protein